MQVKGLMELVSIHENFTFAAFHLVLSKKFCRRYQQAVFNGREPGCEFAPIITGLYRNTHLGYHRSAIQFAGDEMNAGSVIPVPGVQCTLIGICASVQRQ